MTLAIRIMVVAALVLGVLALFDVHVFGLSDVREVAAGLVLLALAALV